RGSTARPARPPDAGGNRAPAAERDRPEDGGARPIGSRRSHSKCRETRYRAAAASSSGSTRQRRPGTALLRGGAPMSTRREEIRAVDGIPTFILTIGLGPPVLVIHGGPGFDHRYLLPAVAELAKRRTLILYDQPGCGRTPAPSGGVTAEVTFRH